MEMNYWPDLDHEESTKEIFKFINLLEEQLIKKYQNKLMCKLEEITYESHGIASTYRALADIGKIVGPQEEKGTLEKSKKKVNIKMFKEYKFLIYNDKYFFRVFDVRIGEYFPVEMRPAEELSDDEWKYSEIESIDAFKHRVRLCLNHKTIKDVISYMMSL